MKKFFSACFLTACLLFTGCSDNSDVVATDSGKIIFTPKPVSKIETKGIGAELTEEEIVPPDKAATKRQIDWNRAPRFNNFDTLVEYLNTCKKNLQTYQPVVCTDGFVPDSGKIPNTRPIQWIQWTNYGGDEQNTYILYEMTNYPGERVAWAYTHDDTSFLSEEERRLYDVAVQIVNEAKNFSSDSLAQELYIHDTITERTTYFTQNPQPKLARFQSALGALIDGKANCQGYSDAFYMLATMCGLNADKVSGVGNNESHVWNTISFGNQSYFVDVTWNDGKCNFNNVDYNYYLYFNAPTDLTGTDHRWYTAHVPQNLQASPDGRNFYHAKEYENSDGKYFGAWSLSANDALDHIAYRIAQQGWKISWVEAPYDATYKNVNNAVNYLLNRLTDYGWRGHINVNVQWRGNKYMYFTVEATPN